MTTPSLNTRRTIGPSLHPEEPRSGVTKGEGKVPTSILRGAMLRIAPQDEGSEQ